MLAIVASGSDKTPEVFYPVMNDHGDVKALLDATGSNIVARYEYDPWGNVLSASGPATDICPFRWQTKYFDNETGLYYFGYRFFDSLTGRWLSRDPLAENGGVNLYAFCNNDPVNGVDGLGLWGIQFGDFQIGVGDMWMEFRANAEMAEALHGGVSIVTSTLTFGLSDKVKLTDSSQYQGGAFTVSRVGATVGREALITAATLGLGTAARGGSAIAQTAYKGLLVTEAATGGYQAGQGINAFREGDTVNGAIDILAGSLRVGGSILSASEFTKLAKSTASGPASKIHITEAVSQDVQNGVTRPAGGVKAAKNLRLPATDATLAETRTLGYTTPNGRVYLRPGLSRVEQLSTLKHESVHVFFSPRGSGPVATLRQNLGQWGYNNSQLLRFTEEAIAEAYSSGSLYQGLRHPLVNGYGITTGGLILECSVLGYGIVGAAHIGNQFVGSE